MDQNNFQKLLEEKLVKSKENSLLLNLLLSLSRDITSQEEAIKLFLQEAFISIWSGEIRLPAGRKRLIKFMRKQQIKVNPQFLGPRLHHVQLVQIHPDIQHVITPQILCQWLSPIPLEGLLALPEAIYQVNTGQSGIITLDTSRMTNAVPFLELFTRTLTFFPTWYSLNDELVLIKKI